MNRHEGLERELTVWLADVATPRVPDYTNDIVQLTARQRQRPRWTFLERWLPMSTVPLERVSAKGSPWRTLGLVAVLAILAVLLFGVAVGSLPKTVLPYGLAANGLVAYSHGGDIYTIDPATGVRRAIVTGPEIDLHPRWSLDGTRLAFVRAHGELASQLVIVDGDGGDLRVVSTESLGGVDDDGIKWSPDGRSIALKTGRGVLLVDSADGSVTRLPVSSEIEMFWRPPDGREILFLSPTGLMTVSLADESTGQIPVSRIGHHWLRPMGWTPDGTRIVATYASTEASPMRTALIDPDTGAETVLDVAFGHVSNDGTRVAGLRPADGSVCVVEITGGPCIPIGLRGESHVGSHGEGLQWSPDDEWIFIRLPEDTGFALVEPDAGEPEPPQWWIVEGAESWQRRAP